MAKISRDFTVGNLHPRENIVSTGNIAAANAEVILRTDGCSTVSVDVRGTMSLTLELTGTVDGTNYFLIPFRLVNPLSLSTGYLSAFAFTVSNTITAALPSACQNVRIRCTAYTSGSAAVVMLGSVGQLDQTLMGTVSSGIGTVTSAVGVAATLTLAAPAAGLRHYITYLSLNRFATALLTAAATPLVITTTNLPGSLAFSRPADAAAQGTFDNYREDFAFPIQAVAAATATTIVFPATPLVIPRLTAGFYVAP